MSAATWTDRAEARRAEIRANYDKPVDPEWVQRVRAAKRARREAAKLVAGNIEWQHSMGEHSEQAAGPHSECPACELSLDAGELLREHRGW